jgi:hypothetical protein
MPSRSTVPEPDDLKRLDALRPAFERLKAERILAEGEIERLRRELEAARAEARAAIGTDDLDEIRLRIEAARARNAALIDAFAAEVRAIEARLAALGGAA